ncbi:hypothetical protein MTX25_35335 [Bradyrhizobium sp. ISRA432]|uniref:hypothetical protein n=1 Tax=unclassified Bradyrhizobium TaxID=2631580 RepID=UPI002478A5C9|nr:MULTISPECIES: hypothetical protein [unclassified Bradyrhizobium]WGR75438.1 hypothetical protein MTX21_20750 [Bradyrhizobium sp. ISRA430]WGR85841.1 hypothetical protein MTX25_35335 [Bradyrhizobium sp. ISRA432]
MRKVDLVEAIAELKMDKLTEEQLAELKRLSKKHACRMSQRSSPHEKRLKSAFAT